MGVRVRLIPMSEAEFGVYEQAEVQEFAAANVQAGCWAAEDALEHAWKIHRALLPEGILTAGHHFCSVIDAGSGRPVGGVWWFEDRGGRVPRAFIYHIIINQPMRRRGYGSAALVEVEEQARSLGMRFVGLHVFAHNPQAIRVYEQVGFRTTGLNMEKRLSG
jgi:GNAT superfamily N-acetyltransferase